MPEVILDFSSVYGASGLVAFNHVPEQLRAIPSWVVWGEGKIPLCARGGPAKSNDPSTWATFDEVRAAYEKRLPDGSRRYRGIGFVFDGPVDGVRVDGEPGHGIVGIDLDHCITREVLGVDALGNEILGPEKLNDLAKGVLSQVNSYTEISPSGEGLHILCYAQIPASLKKAGIEIYSNLRYFTITGDRWPGTPEDLRERKGEVAGLYRQYTGAAGVQGDAGGDGTGVVGPGQGVRVMKVLSKTEAKRLFNTGWFDQAKHPSWREDHRSEIDYALCLYIACTAPRDEGERWASEETIDRLYRMSHDGRTRTKWDRGSGPGLTYGQRTIRQVLADLNADEARRKSLIEGGAGVADDEIQIVFVEDDEDDEDDVTIVHVNGAVHHGGTAFTDGQSPPDRPPESQFFDDRDPAAEEFTDLGNAKRLMIRYIGQVRYVPGIGWLIWNGFRWKRDESLGIENIAQQTVRQIINEAAAVPAGPGRTAHLKWAKDSQSVGHIAAVEKLARANENLILDAKQLDTNKWLVNFTNGTFDGRREVMELREHRRSDFITKVAEVNLILGLDTRGWQYFIDTYANGRSGWAAFIQRAFGYSCTGDTAEKAVFVCQGDTNTGKTTLLNAIKSAMGPYCISLASESFLLGRQVGSIRHDLALLPGIRMVITSEITKGARLDPEIIKKIAGGDDEMQGRELYKSQISFVPQCKLWLALNDLPKVSSMDGALWDRLKCLLFEVAFEKNPALAERLIRDPDMMEQKVAWLIEGLRMYHEEGLNPPRSVLMSTQKYRDSEDPTTEFITDCCREGVDCAVRSVELYQAFRTYQKRNGVSEKFVMGQKTFASAMKSRLGAEGHEHRRDGSWFVGIELNQPDEVPVD